MYKEYDLKGIILESLYLEDQIPQLEKRHVYEK